MEFDLSGRRFIAEQTFTYQNIQHISFGDNEFRDALSIIV